MVPRTIGGVERDYLLSSTRAATSSTCRPTRSASIRSYTGGETPTLNRMGGADWQKTRAKVRSAVREIADELVVLYRQRLATPGHAFAPDTPWQHEIEEAFPYEETPDQLQAIDDVKADMERPVPMDRLVCGDVGYGKTEVAMRAAFKAVQDGKQVASSCRRRCSRTSTARRSASASPTTRCGSRCSRASSPTKEQNAVVRDVRVGAVDVVIGTHRLLSKT